MITMRLPIVKAVSAGLCALLFLGCAQEASDAGDRASGFAPLSIEAALTSDQRLKGDAVDDASRRPADVLAFVDADSGDTIFEIEAGGGYYTELFSKLVGPDGVVLMQNPEPFDSFAGEKITERLDGNRLSNVRRLKSNFDMLEAQDQSVDIVTWFLGPHELYYRPPGVTTLGDVEESYAEIFRILKPGGYFVVLDHAAPEGAPTSSGNDLHRIDPAIVKELATLAGFELVEESDILANPDDQYELGVFDPSVRRKTDRFLFKFQKPAA